MGCKLSHMKFGNGRPSLKLTGGCIFMKMSIRETALSSTCSNLPKHFGSCWSTHSETPTLRANNSENTDEIP